MMLKKKSSLSLSINAIVILVLAISMLGLGLGFTKSMFAKFGSKLDVPAPNIPATEEEPITVESETLNAKINKDFAFGFNIYNPTASDATIITPTIDCGTGSPLLSSASGVINAQSYSPFKAIVTASTPTTAKTFLCTITVNYASATMNPAIVAGAPTYTKQITLQYS